MSEKKTRILINAITIEHGNIIPLLLKIKLWQSKGFHIAIFCNDFLKKRIDKEGIVGDYEYIELRKTRLITSKAQFILEAIRRNMLAFSYRRDLAARFEIIYSISSVMDLIIFPYLLKRKNPEIKWLTVFDNIVPISDPGNKLLRFLAWLFFQVSLFFLKRVDKIFAISQELKKYMVTAGFDEKKIVVTGNAVEIDLIKKASKNDQINIDALFVGRINETKGIYDMLKVLLIVKEKFPDFQLAIMGKGDDSTENQFRKKIKDLNLEQNINFLGYIAGQEKFNIIKSSKSFWFLSTSQSESFGIALLEAVCLGVKTFAYDLEPYKNIYKNKEVIISAKGDYIDVADKVVKLFESGDFDNSNGVKLIDKYNWDTLAGVEAKSF
ncbi:MAG: Glycosyltransferase, family 4 [Parcubacteria group bacterium GW2011_GWD2_38_11]|nr:MAG: Glycosyltransferase, family 4 [Parcubacteria group bacterium GW2011_GWD2_38_11]